MVFWRQNIHCFPQKKAAGSLHFITAPEDCRVSYGWLDIIQGSTQTKLNRRVYGLGQTTLLSFSESPRESDIRRCMRTNDWYCSASTRHVTRAQHVSTDGCIMLTAQPPTTTTTLHYIDTWSMLVVAGASLWWARLKPPLVEKWTSIPVLEAHLYWKSNRYKRFGTKAPPLWYWFLTNRY
jgi:hypothetical protein